MLERTERKLKFTSLLIVCTASACASAPRFRPTPPPADKAVLYVYRPSRALGGLVPITVTLDGQKAINIFSGDYHTLTVNPGSHYLVPYGGKAEHQAAFTAVAGQESYVKVEPGFLGPKVTAMDSSQGQREIQPCRQPD